MAMDVHVACQGCGQPMLETRINLTDDPIPICHNLKCNSIVNEMTASCQGCRGALKETRINLVDPPLLTCPNLECPLILGPQSMWPAWLSTPAVSEKKESVKKAQISPDVETTQNLLVNLIEKNVEEKSFLENELGAKIFRPPTPWSPLPLIDDSELEELEWASNVFRQDLPALLSPIRSNQSSESDLDSDSDQSQASRVGDGQQHKYAKYFVKASESTEDSSPFKKPWPRNAAEKSVLKTGQSSALKPKSLSKNGSRNESKKEDDINMRKSRTIPSHNLRDAVESRVKRRKETNEESRQNVRRKSLKKDDATLVLLKADSNPDQHGGRITSMPSYSMSNGAAMQRKDKRQSDTKPEEVNESKKSSTNLNRSFNRVASLTTRIHSEKTFHVAQKRSVLGQKKDITAPRTPKPIKFVSATDTELIMPSMSQVSNGKSIENMPNESDMQESATEKKSENDVPNLIKRQKTERVTSTEESSSRNEAIVQKAKRSIGSKPSKSNTSEKPVLSPKFKSESVPKSNDQSAEIVGKGRFVVSFDLRQQKSAGRVRVSSQEEAKAVHTLLREKARNSKDSKAGISANAKARRLLPKDVLAYIDNACSKKDINSSNNSSPVGGGSEQFTKRTEKGSPNVLVASSKSKESSFEGNEITLPSESELDRQWSQRLEKEWPREQSLTANLSHQTIHSDKHNVQQNEVDMELMLPNNMKVSLKAAPILPQASSNRHSSFQYDVNAKVNFKSQDSKFQGTSSNTIAGSLGSSSNFDCTDFVTSSPHSPDKKNALKDIKKVAGNPPSKDASMASKMLDALKIKRKKETAVTTSAPSPLMTLERTFVRGGKQETRIKRDLERRAAKKSKLNFRGWQKEQGQQRKQVVRQKAQLQQQQGGQQQKQTVKGVETRNGEKKVGGALARLFSQAESIGGVKKVLNTKSQSVKIVPPVTATPTSTTVSNDVTTPSTSKKHVAHVSEEERALLDDLFNFASDVVDNDIVDNSLGIASQSHNNSSLNLNQNLIDGPSGINVDNNLDFDQSFLFDL